MKIRTQIVALTVILAASLTMLLAGSVDDDRLTTISKKAAPAIARACLTMPADLKDDFCA